MGTSTVAGAAFAVSILSATFTGWYAVTAARQHHRESEPRIEVKWITTDRTPALSIRHVGGPALRSVTATVGTAPDGTRPITGLGVDDNADAESVSLGRLCPGDTKLVRVTRAGDGGGDVLIRLDCKPKSWRPWRRGWHPVPVVTVPPIAGFISF